MNPHFYAELPTLPKSYKEFFREEVKIDPTEDFRHANKFYVLTDRPDCVYIMTNKDLLSFGNFWCGNNAVIFKGLGDLVCFFPVSDVLPDIGGRLREGSIIKASLSGTYCGFCETPPVSTVPGSWPTVKQRYPSMIWECLIGCQDSVDFGLCICTRRVPPDSLVRCDVIT